MLTVKYALMLLALNALIARRLFSGMGLVLAVCSLNTMRVECVWIVLSDVKHAETKHIVPVVSSPLL